MTLRSWARKLFARTPRTVRKAPARRRPALEALEDRLALTTNVTVNTLAELRAAISNANVATDDWVITLNPGTYTLAGNALDNANVEGDLDINKSTGLLTLIGAGAGPVDTLIDGDEFDRVFHVLNGTVTFRNLTIQNGFTNDDGTSADAEARGGGLLNDGGTVTLDNVVVRDNGAFANDALVSDSPGHNGFGGGVANVGGTLTVLESTITDNQAGGGRGAGTGIPGDGLGGGLATRQGTVIVSRSLLSFNQTFGGLNEDFSDASGGGAARGGGLYSKNTRLTISDSTVSGNGALAGGSFAGGSNAEGGGIHIQSSSTAPARIANSTIVRNGAAGCPDGDRFGGGVFSGGEASPVVVSTIVAENTVEGDGTLEGPDVFGTFTSAFHNLIGIGAGSTSFTNNTDGAPSDDDYEQVGTADTPLNPMLGDLDFNGGRAQTHALLPGSPALHTGSNPDGLATDQRGIGSFRVQGPQTDVGAYEVQGAAPTDITLSNSSVAENQPSGTVVGTFNTTDPDSGDPFTYRLVEGDGDTDNALFRIGPDGTLLTDARFDFEVRSSYSIRVESTDADGRSTVKVFTISVTDVTEVPTTTVVTSNPVLTLGRGRSVRLRAEVSSPAGTVDVGSVTFAVPGVGKVTADVKAGVATARLVVRGGVAPGRHTVVATYNATGSFTGSSGRGTLTVRPAPGLYMVPGSGPQRVTFVYGPSDSAFRNQLGFAVVDGGGAVGGVRPGEPAYARAVLQAGQVVFDARVHRPGATRSFLLRPGQCLLLFLVQNGTRSQALAHNPLNRLGGPAVTFLALAGANPDGVGHLARRNLGGGGSEWRWEDLTGGGDRDFNDMVVSITRRPA